MTTTAPSYVHLSPAALAELAALPPRKPTWWKRVKDFFRSKSQANFPAYLKILPASPRQAQYFLNSERIIVQAGTTKKLEIVPHLNLFLEKCFTSTPESGALLICGIQLGSRSMFGNAASLPASILFQNPILPSWEIAWVGEPVTLWVRNPTERDLDLQLSFVGTRDE